MNKQLEQILYESFPLLYRGRNLDRSKTNMHYGLAVGNGWFGPIYKTSKVMEPMLEELKAKLPPEGANDLPCLVQVKEKYGGLRFYLDCRAASKFPEGSETIKQLEELASKVEEDCNSICERCGHEKAKLRTEGRTWIRTLCGACNRIPAINLRDPDAD
jgi:hypothetical protein